MADNEFFEAIYRRARGDRHRLGWTRPGPASILTDWLKRESREPGTAMVVACGVGDDAEHLASLGWDVSAFDISPTAIAWARDRTDGKDIDYRVADLFALPDEWRRGFELVVEVWTIQSVPPHRARQAVDAIADLVADGGTLLVSTLTSLDPDRAVTGPPWPVDPQVLEMFDEADLTELRRDESPTPYPSVGQLEVEYRRG